MTQTNHVFQADGTAEELLQKSGCESLEDAFVHLIGTEEGLLA